MPLRNNQPVADRPLADGYAHAFEVRGNPIYSKQIQDFTTPYSVYRTEIAAINAAKKKRESGENVRVVYMPQPRLESWSAQSDPDYTDTTLFPGQV